MESSTALLAFLAVPRLFAPFPPHWLADTTVASVEESVRTCIELGGSILRPSGDMCGARVAIIRDPAGAVCALDQAAR